MIDHLGHLAFSRSEALDDGADEVLRDVDGELLDRLHHLIVDALGDDLGTADHQLEAFAAHHLDENAELQFAAAEHLEGVRRTGVLHLERDVGEQFLVETVAEIARGDELAFAAGEGRVVDVELDRDRGLVDGDLRQRLRIFDIAEALADEDAGDAGDGDDIADLGLVDVGALEAGEAEELGDLVLGEGAVDLARRCTPGRCAWCR